MSRDNMCVLVAEDDDDFILLAEAARKAGLTANLMRVKDGAELMDYLLRRGRHEGRNKEPRLVLLDINMPGNNGFEALREMKSIPGIRSIPVIVVATSASAEVIDRAYSLGAASFIHKSLEFQRFLHSFVVLRRYWFETVLLPQRAAGPNAASG
ncbi:MAG: response regulator [Nitrospinae bacterium]|nr:response regulator [Nitrospinota bacterium]